MKREKICIAGAGLAGSLMAGLLAQRGFCVEVYESRSDLRKTDISAGRSINLALSHRGLRALEKTGIKSEILKLALPMPARAVHPLGGELFFSPYGKDESLYINSISRGGLNAALLNWAESFEEVTLFFEQSCLSSQLDEKSMVVLDERSGEKKRVEANLLIAADGANSALRRSMDGQVPGFEASVTWENHGYKELRLDPDAAGQWKLEKKALHIWPRGGYMLIALPNLDGSFTCTLFMAMDGEEASFAKVQGDAQVRSFFEREFPNISALMPNLVEEYAQNPVGKLGTLRCKPWVYEDKLLLLGDAAHAVVPFYGQGMNASFEDCIVLDECIEAGLEKGWKHVLAEYEKQRRENGLAIADLAVENFFEMRDHVADPVFQRKRALERKLENRFEDYRSKYSLVTFHPEVGYSYAKARGNAQDAWLMNYCKELNRPIEDINLDALYQKLLAELGQGSFVAD